MNIVTKRELEEIKKSTKKDKKSTKEEVAKKKFKVKDMKTGKEEFLGESALTDIIFKNR